MDFVRLMFWANAATGSTTSNYMWGHDAQSGRTRWLARTVKSSRHPTFLWNKFCSRRTLRGWGRDDASQIFLQIAAHSSVPVWTIRPCEGWREPGLQSNGITSQLSIVKHAQAQSSLAARLLQACWCAYSRACCLWPSSKSQNNGRSLAASLFGSKIHALKSMVDSRTCTSQLLALSDCSRRNNLVLKLGFWTSIKTEIAILDLFFWVCWTQFGGFSWLFGSTSIDLHALLTLLLNLLSSLLPAPHRGHLAPRCSKQAWEISGESWYLSRSTGTNQMDMNMSAYSCHFLLVCWKCQNMCI